MKALNERVFGVPLMRWLALLVMVTGLILLSVLIRDRLDIEWSIESVRSFVADLGAWSAVAYMAILSFRFLFLVPSSLLLIAGGILFGPVFGTVYAGLGLWVSGLIKFVFVSIVGRDVLLSQLPVQLRNRVVASAQSRMSGWLLIAIGAYPFFPKHVFQLGAILSGMKFYTFAAAVLVGSVCRAAIFCFIGQAIYAGTHLQWIGGSLLLIITVPLIVPSWRQWLLSPVYANKHASHSTYDTQAFR